MIADEQDIPVLPEPINPSDDQFAVFRHTMLPGWALVRHRLAADEIDGVASAVADAFATVAARIRPGLRVCLAVGSRGIARTAEVTRAAVSVVRAAGAEVFIVPAMGSHGGATADGQLEVLASLGVTPESVGCEIRSSMETVQFLDYVLAKLPFPRWCSSMRSGIQSASAPGA